MPCEKPTIIIIVPVYNVEKYLPGRLSVMTPNYI